MGSGHDGGTTPQSSEPLCELALALAAEIDDYERRGGDDIVRDVVMREPYDALFDATASNTARTRPAWRWDVVLRHGPHTEVVVGTPNGGWQVETIMLLRGLAQHHEQGAVVVDLHGSEEGLMHPPPDDDSPANRAMVGGLTAGGYLAGGAIGAVVGRLLSRNAGPIRTPRWHPDPGGTHALRYWNGVRWTRFVYSVHDRPEPDADRS